MRSVLHQYAYRSEQHKIVCMGDCLSAILQVCSKNAFVAVWHATARVLQATLPLPFPVMRLCDQKLNVIHMELSHYRQSGLQIERSVKAGNRIRPTGLCRFGWFEGS